MTGKHLSNQDIGTALEAIAESIALMRYQQKHLSREKDYPDWLFVETVIGKLEYAAALLGTRQADEEEPS